MARQRGPRTSAQRQPGSERIPGEFEKAPGTLTREDYEKHNWLRPEWAKFPTQDEQQGQQRTQPHMDLGEQHNPLDMKRQATFNDLPEDVRNKVAAGVKKRLGVSFDDMVGNFGKQIDSAYLRGELDHKRPEGESYYYQGHDLAKDKKGQTMVVPTDQQQSGELASRLGVNPALVHYGRAALSHNSNPSEDIKRVESVVKSMQQSPDVSQFKEGGTSSRGFNWNARNAGRIMQGMAKGVHPLDVEGETVGGTPAKAVAGSTSSIKPPTYGDAQEFPRVRDANPVVDRHVIRGAAGIKDFGEDTRADRFLSSHNSKSFFAENPFHPGEQIDAANLYIGHALRTAAQQRGLPSHVAQGVQWYEQKNTSVGSPKRSWYPKPKMADPRDPYAELNQRNPSPGRQGLLFGAADQARG